jgi:hypothetical protein
MWTRTAVVLGLAAASAALVTGCTIETCEEGAICEGDGRHSAQRECRAACGRLAECGRIDESERWACLDSCLDSLWEDESTEDYCECVEQTSCFDLSRECGRPPFDISAPACGEDEHANSRGECVPDEHEPALDASAPPVRDAGAPPPRDAGPADAAPARDAAPAADAAPASHADAAPPVPDATAAADAANDAAPCPCASDQDCPSGQACLDGLCRAQCTVSCECGAGHACRDGLCVPAEASCAGDAAVPQVTSCAQPLCLPPV